MNVKLQKKRAWELFNNHKADEARLICEQIWKADAADAETYYLLGCCYNKARMYSAAATVIQKSLKINPKVPKSLFVLGFSLEKLNRNEDAVEVYKAILDIKPKMFRAHCALADALYNLGLSSEARIHFEKAMELKPERTDSYIGLASILWKVDSNIEGAIKHFETAIELRPSNLSFRCMLANALMEVRRIDDSFDCFREVLQISPEYTRAIAGLARLYNIKGQYEESMKQIDLLRSKEIYSSMAAVAFTSICKHLNNCEDALTYAKKCIDSNQNAIDTDESLHMHIARVYDSLGRYDEAWEYVKKGNKLTEGLYDTVNQKLLTEQMIKVFSYTNILSMPKSSIDSKRPIFIVGMPRSGTSLVEQILAAHPDVYGGGELSYLSDVRVKIMQQIGAENIWPDYIQELSQDDLNRWATEYLERVEGISDSAKRVTDKMPHNFSELGFIQMLFPDAHIIHCNRNPRDTCLSIYFQNFLSGHEYSRSLFHIGVHYHQYLEIMSHWRSHLSRPFLDVQYEELVNDPEVVVRQMLKHCNLEWHDGCLDFHKVKRQVHTASYDQVRQPLYTKSIERWRHYEKYLSELEAGLERGF